MLILLFYVEKFHVLAISNSPEWYKNSAAFSGLGLAAARRVRLSIKKSLVRLPVSARPGSHSGQVVHHTSVPLSQSSITVGKCSVGIICAVGKVTVGLASWQWWLFLTDFIGPNTYELNNYTRKMSSPAYSLVMYGTFYSLPFTRNKYSIYEA